MILYSELLDAVVADVTQKIGLFSHIDPAKILIIAARRTTQGYSGALAECIALRLPEEPAIEFRYQVRTRRVTAVTPWFVPKNRRVSINGQTIRYVLRFRLPRFIDHAPARSIIHELLHISDKFDGTHRALRHGVWFERYVRTLEREWRQCGDPKLIELIDLKFRDLQRQFGSVVCRTFSETFKTPFRLPATEHPRLMHHPEVQRLELTVGAGPLERLPFRFDDASRLRLTEKDLEYRAYTQTSSEVIPPELLSASLSSRDRRFRLHNESYIRFEKKRE